MDMGISGEKEGKIGSESNRGVEPFNYHSPNNNRASVWRFISPNLSNHQLGEDSERDLTGSSSVTMVDSFSPTIWDQPTSSNNVQINATTSNSPLIRKGVPVMGWENPNMMSRGRAFLQLPQSLSQFPADSAFIERAARYSSFNNRNFSDMVSFSISNSLNPYSSDSARMQGPQDISNLDALRGDANKTELKMTQVGDDSNINHATTEGSSIKLDKQTNHYLRSPNEKKYGTSISNNQSDEREFSGGGEIEERSMFDSPRGENSAVTKGLGTKKRKKISLDTEIDQDKGASPLLTKDAKGNNKSKEKVDQNQTSSTSRASWKMVKDGSQPSDAGKEEYMHVCARRGQATNSHSLAERVRREKISERMKFLQELVPGCNKVTGKAVMLDEIINYVQSLQRQVEFLSMKLATVNPHLDLNNEVLLAKDILMAQGGPSAMGFSPDMSMVHAQQALLQGIPNMGNSLDTLRRTISSQLGLMGSGYKDLPQSANAWDDELHNVVQTAFGSNRHFNNLDLNDSLPQGQMKAELRTSLLKFATRS